MLRLIRALAAAFAASVPLTAQATALIAPCAPPSVLSAFDVAAATLQSLTVPVERPLTSTVVVVLGGAPKTIELWPSDVRSASFQLWERTAAGLLPLPQPPECTTFRGRLHGELGSVVAATIDGGSLTAFIRRPSRELWVVQPLRDVVPTAAPSLHVVYRGADNVATTASCGAIGAAVPTAFAMGGGDALWECDLAIEADHPLFVLNGSSIAQTQNDVLAVVNAMDLIYQSDVEIRLQVSQLVVDTIPDPYTTSVAAQLCAQFRSHWNQNHAALQRDVAQLFSGRAIGAASAGTIGYAYIGTACDLQNAYGVAQTSWSTNFAYRVAVSAHELGHNFNATHCDGQPACSLMCSSIGGCAANPNAFSVPEQTQIVAFRQGAACLMMVPTMPHVTSVTPVQLQTVNPATVLLGGSGLLGTTSVTVGGQTVTTGIQVLSDTQLRFVPPQGLPLGFHATSVTNPAGTSNAVVLWYQGSDPCQAIVQDAVAGGGTLTWTLGGWPQDIGYLGISFFGTTSPFFGEQLLDDILVLWMGVLDPRGMESCTVPVPAGLLSSCTVYSQMIDVMSATPTLRSVSPVYSTWVY